MKRDMDLVREILLRVEQEDSAYFKTVEVDDLGNNIEKEEEVAKIKKMRHHISIINGEKFVEFLDVGTGAVAVGLTWKGHDFIDTIRDPDVWRKTKDGAKKAGGAGFAFIAELAKAYARAELQKLGLPLV